LLKLGQIALALAFASCAAATAHAAEHVTLTDGRDFDCVRREAHGDRVRLYLTAESYVEVLAQRVASIEHLPDQPQPEFLKPAATLADLLAKAGAEHKIDTDLLASVIKAESGGNVTAVSRAGAQGLMQLMPGTAAELGVKNAFAADQNIAGGAAYLDQLLTRYHDDLQRALAAYNAGPAAVDKFHGVPPFRETRDYVTRVILEYNRRKLELRSKLLLAAAR
jgi:soluble lytic murein transglycosylase-like protein